MKMRVEVKGIKELEKNIQQMIKEMKDASEQGTVDAANYAAGIVRHNAPGSLKNAVTTKPLPTREQYPPNTMVGLLWDGYQHAHLVEFGTGPRYTAGGAYRGQMPATPFFRQSIDAARAGIKQRIAARAREPIDRRR